MATSLEQVTDFPALVEYLRDELEWPIAEADFEALTFDYKPEEVGLDSAKVGGGIEIRQLRPLNRKQPWGIFFVNLPKKHLSTTILRTLLGSLAPKKRASSNPAERAVFDQRDLMFIANTGEAGHRHIDFAHFRNPEEGQRTAPLQVLGWDADDTERRMKLTSAMLKEKLHWPEPSEDVEAWRERWTAAFREPPRYPIKQSKLLAEEMAKLAKRIRGRVAELIAVETDKGALRRLHAGFKEALIHDLTPDKFADYYAQTITYGLFSARVSRPSTGFGHDTIHLNVAGTSPFLKEMLEQFLEAGGRKRGSGGDDLDFDALGVGDVIAMLEATDMDSVLADWDHKNQDEDPVVHFYQDFLDLYDPGEKKKRGVFYTPRPVVSFIVRSVDEVLRSEFELEDGLASTTTWAEIIASKPDIKLPNGANKSDPFVRILDPATGTGTFLVECVDLIHKTMVAKWKASGKRDAEIKLLWNDYVPKHLLPRLTGFELMMAPYAIAHVKLGLKLADTGYTFGSDARAQIYLTNALEPAQDLDMQLAFMSEALAHEAKAANGAKETRFTVVVGNPPYSNFGQNNRNSWISGLLADYKRDLGEKKLNLDDDYIKFIRLSQMHVEHSGTGIAGLITNSSYLDGQVHRQMRRALLSTFSRITIVDLHGNSRRLERYNGDEQDENVFAIQQGVTIAILSTAQSDCVVRHEDVWGGAASKLQLLSKHTATSLKSVLLTPMSPKFYFYPHQSKPGTEFDDWAALDAVFPIVGSGLNTDRDELCVDFDRGPLEARMQTLFSGKFDLSFVDQYRLQPSSSYDPLKLARKQKYDPNAVRSVIARPFDFRAIYYRVGFTSRPVFEAQGNMLQPNVALLISRQSKEPFAVLATNLLSMHKIVTVYDRTSLAPLWIVPAQLAGVARPNIASAVANRVAALTGLAYDDCVEGPQQGALGGIIKPKPQQTAMFAGARRERGERGKSFGPRDLFDFIYAVLHSPTYRTRYADYLKSDYARVPLPRDRLLFDTLVPIGTELVALHLLDADALPILKDPKTVRLAGSGEARITAKPDLDAKLGRVAINATRWFETVPEVAWNFHIGGYQPAEKWLKDRAAKGGKKASPGRVLTDEDILHYRRMIVALARTAELMPKIDEAIEKHGGWPGAFSGMTDATRAKAAE